MNHPLQPLSPMQRLGWLKHFSRIRCAKSFAGFSAGELYPLLTATAQVRVSASRMQRDGALVPVVLTGADLLVKIGPGAADDTHRFLAHPQSLHPWVHDLSFLIAHFHIPEIPDQALLCPAVFAQYQKKLRALEK